MGEYNIISSASVLRRYGRDQLTKVEDCLISIETALWDGVSRNLKNPALSKIKGCTFSVKDMGLSTEELEEVLDTLHNSGYFTRADISEDDAEFILSLEEGEEDLFKEMCDLQDKYIVSWEIV